MESVNEITRQIGTNLRSARESIGLSLNQVERLTDGEFKHSAVGAYERGERVIPSDKLVMLAKVYDVSAGFMMIGLSS